MNQVNLLTLPIVFAAMFSLNQIKEGEKKHPQPTVAEQKKVADTVIVNDWRLASEKHLSRWHAFHEKNIKGFSANDFVLVDTFHDVQFIELDVTELDPALVKYRIPAPNAKSQLDIYGYGRQLLSGKDGELELAAQSLDSEVALYGMAANKKLRLLFCGATCLFEDAAWIADDMLIVAGTSSEVNEKNHPMLWGIQLSTRSVFRFMHPAELPVAPNSFFNTVILSK